MRRSFYQLPHSAETVSAFVLWQEEKTKKALLLVPPVENVRGATLVIAKRNADLMFEDCDSSTFALDDKSAAMISFGLMSLVKDGSINKPTYYVNYKLTKYFQKLTFRQADGTTCRAWFCRDLGEAKMIFVERGAASVTVEIARAGDDGIFEAVQDYPLNQEEREALAEAKHFVAEALKPEEPD